MILKASSAMDHPSVELKLPLDGGTHRVEIPQETTLFFWGAVAPGTTDRLIPEEGDAVGSQHRVVQELSNYVSWRISFRMSRNLFLTSDTENRDITGEHGGLHGVP